MSESHTLAAVLARLELVRADIESTIDQSDNRTHWRNLVRGVLIHWLSEMYEEGAGYTADMETSLAIAKRHVQQLKLLNDDLQEEIKILRDAK